MTAEGQVVLFRFPRTDQVAGKLRPALLLRALPGPYDDWLVCMISTRLYHAVPGIDEILPDTEPDFASTGLKSTSLIRLTRLAVVSADIIEGTLGQLAVSRLERLRTRLGEWITAGTQGIV